MSKNKTLFANSWLSLMQIEDPDKGVSGYVYAHETRCDGKIVLILPFRGKKDSAFGGIEVMFRREVTPSWDMNPRLSGITGGVEEEDPAEDALRELEEEAGYTLSRENLIFLGTAYASKAMDTVYYLYAVNVDGQSQQNATGDGSRLESEGSVEWHDSAMECEDAVATCAYFRLVFAMMHWRQNK